MMTVFILGSGNAGSGLARALRSKGVPVTIRSGRRPPPRQQIQADVVLLAVRDKDLGAWAERLGPLVRRSAVCLHIAGARDAETLSALRPACAGVGKMHPMIAFASKRRTPRLDGGHVHVAGDVRAVKAGRRLAKILGMVPRDLPHLDGVSYHAAAALVANGAAALAGAGKELLLLAGVRDADVPHLLGPLLRSVADNVEALGLPCALTGPIRRGDAGSIEKQRAFLAARAPGVLPLWTASGRAQVPLARAIGDAPPGQLAQIETLLQRGTGPKVPR